MVAEAQEELAHRLDVEVHGPGLEAARIHLDGQDDAEVVEHGGDGGPDEDLEVRDAEERGDDEGGRSQGGRGHDGADAGGSEDGTAVFLRVAGLAEQRPGDTTEGDGRRDSRARDRAEEESREGHRAAGPGFGLAEGREGEVDEELGGPGRPEDRPVDGEQDDVGRCHVGGDTEEPLRAHDVVADEADPVEGRGVERSGDEGAEGGVGEEAHDHQRHEDPDGPA